MRDWATTKTQHGTITGEQLHRELGQQPCAACWGARHEYNQRQKASPDAVIRNRLMARAQGRAMKALRKRHHAEYTALYQEHKERLLAELAGGDPA